MFVFWNPCARAELHQRKRARKLCSATLSTLLYLPDSNCLFLRTDKMSADKYSSINWLVMVSFRFCPYLHSRGIFSVFWPTRDFFLGVHTPPTDRHTHIPRGGGKMIEWRDKITGINNIIWSVGLLTCNKSTKILARLVLDRFRAWSRFISQRRKCLLVWTALHCYMRKRWPCRHITITCWLIWLDSPCNKDICCFNAGTLFFL